MSSEAFENSEMDLQAEIDKLRRLQSQISNYSGEQRRQAVQEAQSHLDECEDLLYDMSAEVQNAPPSLRQRMNAKVTDYKRQVANFKKTITADGARSDLLGGATGRPAYSTRDKALGNRQMLDESSARIANTQRLAAESEEIGHQVMVDLNDQRETIIRSGQKVSAVDANLGKANQLLNGMTRRIMTHKIVMMSTILLLIGILGGVVYLKFFK
ncbi:uncharacterized protein MONBRDRAFT_38961 [Monosiga brevicollis MX1]|uniref:t-SNARE coiled-coil homology domain-containing protein n=1 Tax=Monosiga brevicollis TaxID=81824 RepID=A9VB72_MONBE|nr:uncharacterized protein MONBRDRAFT_38961 [Monosiga brevicollis MX1]EDQ85137.1 predicted protein [Monosiga brevicollis MX1]|eukprot:XP_001749962.1 hypothetical protein [Monosiga brevicollis MX1]